MNGRATTILKSTTILLWLAVAVAFGAPDLLPFSDVLQRIGTILIIAHAVEVILFIKLLRGPSDFLQVFLFGVIHIFALRKLSKS